MPWENVNFALILSWNVCGGNFRTTYLNELVFQTCFSVSFSGFKKYWIIFHFFNFICDFISKSSSNGSSQKFYAFKCNKPLFLMVLNDSLVRFDNQFPLLVSNNSLKISSSVLFTFENPKFLPQYDIYGGTQLLEYKLLSE